MELHSLLKLNVLMGLPDFFRANERGSHIMILYQRE